jgi:hypothetical protein
VGTKNLKRGGFGVSNRNLPILSEWGCQYGNQLTNGERWGRDSESVDVYRREVRAFYSLMESLQKSAIIVIKLNCSQKNWRDNRAGSDHTGSKLAWF